MKKIFCISLVFIFLLFCGCKKSPDVTIVTEGLEFTAEADFYGEKYIFDVKTVSDSHIIFKALSPEKIKDTVFEFKENTLEVKYGALSYKTSVSDLPCDSVVKFIYCNLTEIGNKSIEFYNNEYYAETETCGIKCKTYFSEMGLPLKISDSENQILVIIKNSKIKNSSGT